MLDSPGQRCRCWVTRVVTDALRPPILASARAPAGIGDVRGCVEAGVVEIAPREPKIRRDQQLSCKLLSVIKLTELLVTRGFSSAAKTKLVRHQDRRMDVKMLRRRGFFEFYQRTQAKEVFNCAQIVSFIGDDNGRAIFCGVYEVRGVLPPESFNVPAGFPYPQYVIGPGGLEYDLEKEKGFEDLEDRVVIDWGDAPLAWHQWFKDREVVEVLPAGYVMEWPGYPDVLLSHADLRAIVEKREANREWFRRLSAVAGVYCILDKKTGDQYVGSAYGKDGIWGRWRQYAENIHGGNVVLEQRCASCPDLADHLQYSILQTLPSSTAKDQVLLIESTYKRKLGSRAFGLNAN
jgi:hypothetical protein